LFNKKIAVLMGGISSEREISIKTGEAIYNALIKKGYDAIKIDVDKNFLKNLYNYKFDIAFIALHGKYGEDGIMQGILEFAKIPYTGTSVMGSAVSMNKIITKRIFQALGILTPKFWLEKGDEIEFPVVVKPVAEGSTLGISIVNQEKDLSKAIDEAKKFSDKIFFEEYIKGQEITVSVLCGRALPVIEIRPKKGFYDYESKYNKGMTEYIIPAQIDKEVEDRVKYESELIFKELNCRGAIRVDFIVKDNNAYALEVNTIPGMTPTSLLPKAANYIGLSFEDVVEEILKDARL